MGKTFTSILVVIAISLVFLSTPPSVLAAENSLTVSLGSQNLHPINPAYGTSRHILVLYHNWGDTLLYRDPDRKQIVPCLAESVRWTDPRTLEFKLRKDVHFHNGEPFDAYAVKFSLDLLKSPDSKVSRYLSDLTEAQVMDSHTIRIKTTIGNPTAFEIIANTLFIFPPGYYGKVGKDGFEKHPVGTGPYKFLTWKGPQEICFKANEDYFGGPKGKARIPVLNTVTITEELLQVQALITGKVDLSRSTSALHKQIPFLKQDSDLQLKSVQSLRNNFVCMDSTGRSGVDFFKDRRVRKAVNHAINKNNIVHKQYSDLANIAWSVTSPLHFGHEADVQQYPYDPAVSRELLKEAGYPDGFTVDFFCSGVSESACESIVTDLKAVGINTNMTWMGGEWGNFYRKFLAGEVPLAFLTWGSYSIFDASAILDPFFMKDAPGCYGTTPEIDRMLKEADNTMDQKNRKVLFSKIQKAIAEEAFWAPICTTRSLSVMKKNLNFEPSYDEIDRYFRASWQETRENPLRQSAQKNKSLTKKDASHE